MLIVEINDPFCLSSSTAETCEVCDDYFGAFYNDAGTCVRKYEIDRINDILFIKNKVK